MFYSKLQQQNALLYFNTFKSSFTWVELDLIEIALQVTLHF